MKLFGMVPFMEAIICERSLNRTELFFTSTTAMVREMSGRPLILKLSFTKVFSRSEVTKSERLLKSETGPEISPSRWNAILLLKRDGAIFPIVLKFKYAPSILRPRTTFSVKSEKSFGEAYLI